MQFEWDRVKDAKNRSKHGIDFDSAKGLWDDDNRIEIHAPHREKEAALYEKQNRG